MSAALAPDKGVFMSIPVSTSCMHSLLYLLPGGKTPALQSQRAQHLPPRLDEVQVSSIHGLENELPSRMSSREEHGINRAVCLQVIHNRVHMLYLCAQLSIHPTEEIDIVGSGSAGVASGVCLPISRSERSKDISFAPQPIIDLLFGSCATRFSSSPSKFHKLLARVALDRHRSHLIHTEDYASLWGLGVELDDGPLFWANCGSSSSLACSLTRLPNQRSWKRHFKPSLRKSAPTRLGLIGMSRCSFRYVASLCKVQLPKGRGGSHSICLGSVRAVAITSPTCSCVYVGGRPILGSSAKAETPPLLKRSIQRLTVMRCSCNCPAIEFTRSPRLASHMMRALSTVRDGWVREWASLRTASRSSSVTSRKLISRGIPNHLHLPFRMPLLYTLLAVCSTERSEGSREGGIERLLNAEILVPKVRHQGRGNILGPSLRSG